MDPLEQQTRPQVYWPRRLLHIPSMRSVERSGGNRYGSTDEAHESVVEPPFAALCYTWGRYRSFLDAGSDIAISGLPSSWKIPSIDPRHFTTIALHKVMKTVSRDVGVDFMWIDIACVNTDWKPDVEFEEEVYMQQYIFNTASWSFIWLSETPSSYLSEVAKHIQNIIHDPATAHMKLSRTISCLSTILADPWFSGMWTLLEGARRLDAILLTSDGHSLYLCEEASAWRDKEWSKPTTVTFEDRDRIELQKTSKSLLNGWNYTPQSAALLLSLRDLIHVTRVLLSSSAHSDPHGSLQEAAIKSSLLSFEPFSLLSLYESAQRRTSGSPSLCWNYINDQIFGFPRISISAGEVETKTQFAQNLLLCDPVLSQLFIRQNAAGKEGAWQLTSNCKPLPLDLFLKHFDAFKCLFKVRAPESGSTKAISFQGPTQPLRKLAYRWLLSRSDSGLLALSFDHCILQVADSFREMPPIMLFPTEIKEGYAVCESTIRRHLQQFLEHCGDIEIRVLALATGLRVDRASGLLIGVIIARQRSENLQDHWKRVGICVWSSALEEVNNTTQRHARVPNANSGNRSWEMLSGLGAA